MKRRRREALTALSLPAVPLPEPKTEPLRGGFLPTSVLGKSSVGILFNSDYKYIKTLADYFKNQEKGLSLKEMSDNT